MEGKTTKNHERIKTEILDVHKFDAKLLKQTESGLEDKIMKEVGYIVGYHNDGFVKWIGGFGQVEYNNGKIDNKRTYDNNKLNGIFIDLTIKLCLLRKIFDQIEIFGVFAKTISKNN